METKKTESFNSEDSFFKDIDSKKTKKIYKQMTMERFDKYAVAQFVRDSQYQPTVESALLRSFGLELEDLTDTEQKLAHKLFQLGQSLYLERLYKLVIINDKAHPVLKLVAEIKGFVKSENNIGELSATLNIGVDNTQNEEPKLATGETIKSEPLKLVNG